MKYLVQSRCYNNGTSVVKIHELHDNLTIDYLVSCKDSDIWFYEFDTYSLAAEFVSKITKDMRLNNEKISF